MVEATAQQDTLIASILSLSKFTDDEDSLAIATTGMQSLFERVFDQVDVADRELEGFLVLGHEGSPCAAAS